MKIRKDMIFAVLTTFCMSVLMFAVIPIRSGLPNYDPWADITGPNGVPDDKIDIRDVSNVAKLFGALNTDNLTRNVNVTNWPAPHTHYDSDTSTQSIVIPAHTSGNVNITTDGYSRMTLGLTSSVKVNPIAVSTGFMIGSLYAHMDAINMGGTSKPANAIWLEPSTVPLMGKTVGYRFNVTAWINLNRPSYAWQVACTYDGTVFRVIRAGYTAGNTSQFFSGHNTTQVTPAIGIGYVLTAECLYGSDSRSPGSDSLSWVEFELIASSTEEQLVINNPDTYPIDLNFNEIAITKYDALASWFISTYETYTFKTYSVIGPMLRIDYYNPNDDDANLKIDTYLTTAP